MFVFGLGSTSDDWPGWSMDSNPICHPSPAKKMKCSFLDYVQLLMIGRAGQWTWTPSSTPLQPKKMKCSFLDHVQLLMICRAGRWTRTPSATHLQPKKWNAHFLIMFNFWWSVEQSEQRTSTETQKKPKRPPKSSKNKMFIFGLHSTSDDRTSDLRKKCQLKCKKMKKTP